MLGDLRNPLPLLMVVAAFACSACFVPTIDQLDHPAPWACDEAHPCPHGYDCVAAVCLPREGAGCTPGETSPCGTDEGACSQGTRRCLDDGTFGACEEAITATAEVCNGIDDDCDGDTDEELTTDVCELTSGVCADAHHRCVGGSLEQVCSDASYGPDYESGVETRCDGKDNDCDGDTDEDLTAACALQLGVCDGAASACADGTFPACTEETYQQHDSRYQAMESSCDGADNDCDGLSDRGPPVNLSQTSAAGTHADAVPLSGGGMLVLSEDGGRIRARPVDTTGKLGASVFPARTAELATSAYSPTLATDGTHVFAAWIEEFLPGSFRVMVAELGADGESVERDGTGNALAWPVSSLACLSDGSTCAQGSDCCSESCASVCQQSSTSRKLESVALAAAGGKLYVAVITSGGGTPARGAVLPAVFPPTTSATSFSFPLADATRVALHGGTGRAFAAVETTAGVSVYSIDSTGSVVTYGSVGTPGVGLPQVMAAGLSKASLFAASEDRHSILEYDCSQSGCNSVASADVGADPISSLRVWGEVAGDVRIAWSQTATGGSVRGFVARTLSTPVVASPVGGLEGLAEEPLVLEVDGQPRALFEANSDLFMQWACVPP